MSAMKLPIKLVAATAHETILSAGEPSAVLLGVAPIIIIVRANEYTNPTEAGIFVESACNSYEALVKSLEWAVKELERRGGGDNDYAPPEFLEARAALKLARGEA